MEKIRLSSDTQSYWLNSTDETNYPAITEDVSVDAAIIGGGLAGISAAWLLKQEGLRVAVAEADRICQGTTGHSTAKITSQHDLIYAHIVRQFGKELAKQYAEANETAIRTMADLVQEQKIDCDFSWQPAYVYTEQDKYVEKIRKEAETAGELGIEADFLEHLELPIPVKAALKFNNQAQFHPRKYVQSLANLIPGDGSEIFEKTAVVAVEEGGICTVLTRSGKKIRADKVIVASHFPIHDGLGMYFARMYPERSYILGVRTEGELPQGMYVSAESPGRSIRTQPYGNETMLLVAGEHHKAARGEEYSHYENLRDFAISNFAVTDIPFRWSTQDYSTMDKIPYIGAIRSGSSNIFVATGFRKWGISTSTAAAMIIRDIIVWGSSPWQDVFNPQRGIKLDSAGKLFSINADVAKELVSGKLMGPGHEPIREGEAGIAEVEGHKAGVYRDEEGQLHAVDITCTHFGCELKWNSAEKTWDCPCHGSRFSYSGEVVEGPAVNALKHPAEGNNDIDPDLI